MLIYIKILLVLDTILLILSRFRIEANFLYWETVIQTVPQMVGTLVLGSHCQLNPSKTHP